MRWRLSLCCIVVLAAGAGAGDDANKRFLDKIQGDWKMIKVLTGGKPAPEEKVANTVMTFDKDMITIRQEGKDRKEETAFKIDAGKKPVEIDVFPSKDDAQKLVRGIIRLEGDTLTICFARRGGDRPTEFAAPEGSLVTLMELQRAK